MPTSLDTTESLGPAFERFAARYLVHVAGPSAGRPFLLEQWQRDWTYELLRVDAAGNFVYREALLGIARKNGKSALCSALALFALFYLGARHPGAEIYALAGSLAQARIVFNDAKAMLEASPLRDFARIQRDSLLVKETGAIFRVIPSGRPELLHGLRPLFFIGDEVHAWDDPELWVAMHTAQIHFPSALGVGISTAGFDLNSVLGDLYRRGEAGEEGFYFRWYAASTPDDPATWKEANPSSWITQEALEREAKKLPPAVFHRLHLNVWTRAIEHWLPLGAWDACRTDDRIEDGESLWLGLDLGFKHDHTAVVEVAKHGDTYCTRSTIFATHADASKPRPLAHHVFEDERQSHQAVLAHILEIARRHPINELVYDPAGSALLIEELEAHGMMCVEFPQSHVRMGRATDVLYGLITTQRVTHDGDDAFAAHIAACTVKRIAEGERLFKDRDRSPMDSGIALAIAIARAHEAGGAEFNFWAL